MSSVVEDVSSKEGIRMAEDRYEDVSSVDGQMMRVCALNFTVGNDGKFTGRTIAERHLIDGGISCGDSLWFRGRTYKPGTKVSITIQEPL